MTPFYSPSITSDTLRKEIETSGGIAGRLRTGDFEAEFVFTKPPLSEFSAYVPVCDIRLVGDRMDVEKVALALALRLASCVDWEYGFICNHDLDSGVLPAPYGCFG